MKLINLSLLLIFSMVALHFIGNSVGLYDGEIIWIDNILHIMAGSAVALLWLALAKEKYKKISFTILFVFLLAVIWEIIEFGFLKIFPIYALKYSIYPLNFMETIGDIFSNLVGGGIAFVLWKKFTFQKKKNLNYRK